MCRLSPEPEILCIPERFVEGRERIPKSTPTQIADNKNIGRFMMNELKEEKAFWRRRKTLVWLIKIPRRECKFIISMFTIFHNL